MPNTFGNYCNGCPYKSSDDVEKPQSALPLSIEQNSRETLLIFQAPGYDEWKEKKPICSKNSGSTAARIRNSLLRVDKIRNNFSITNATQCYPGKLETGRDRKPVKLAREKCASWLKVDIESVKYGKIIVFGSLAAESVKHLGYQNDKRFLYLRHPSGGLSNMKLDHALNRTEQE